MTLGPVRAIPAIEANRNESGAMRFCIQVLEPYFFRAAVDVDLPELFFVLDDFFVLLFFVVLFRGEAFFEPGDDFFVPFDEDFVDADFFAGTLPPSRRASESPIAIACFLLVTFLPEPDRNVPFFRSCIVFSTFSCAFLPYLLAIKPPAHGCVQVTSREQCGERLRFSIAGCFNRFAILDPCDRK